MHCFTRDKCIIDRSALRRQKREIYPPYQELYDIFACISDLSPNSWLIRCHRTWTRELAVSCPSTILHVGGGRSSPRNFWCFWYDELWNNRVNIYDKLSLIAQDILAAPASQAYVKSGFSVCGLLTAGRRNRMTKSLQMQACLKLNKKVLANTGINASVWTLEL